MTIAMLEHVNVTVSDPEKTAAMLCQIFDWHIRWKGPSANGGHTIHVGNEDEYLAVYSFGKHEDQTVSSYLAKGGLNHIGIEVDDLEAIEEKVKAAGFKPHSHGDYEPGRRFYFNDADDIEYEVVSYAIRKA